MKKILTLAVVLGLSIVSVGCGGGSSAVVVKSTTVTEATKK